MQERVWRPDWPCSVLGTLRQHRRGGGDPTFRIDDDGTVWRGIRTPEGPATLTVRARPGDGDVLARGVGPRRRRGSLDSVPATARCRRRLDRASSRGTRSSRRSGAGTRTSGSAGPAW